MTKQINQTKFKKANKTHKKIEQNNQNHSNQLAKTNGNNKTI
jgi:hypothetical protein